MNSTRRRWIGQALFSVCGMAGGSAAWAGGFERRQALLVRNQLRCPRLRESQHGIKVLHLTDLHVDDWTPGVVLEQAALLCETEKPDLVVLTGDFISRRPDLLRSRAGELARLRAPLGQFACLGNHDRWHGAGEVMTTLGDLGIRTLVNESVRLQAPGGPLTLAGLDSAWGGRPDARGALRNANPAEPLLLLLHEPDPAEELGAAGLQAAQLSGHTHGGQVRAPWIGAIMTPRLGRKFVRGGYQTGDMHLYVNPGLGTMGVPFRAFCRPEVTVHELVPA
jgi:predicted MPP superfamily phosphohydrolase